MIRSFTPTAALLAAGPALAWEGRAMAAVIHEPAGPMQ
jgi:hypothetical protein